MSTTRHNGHEAVHYQPLADVSPELADSLLEVLACHGIAAYAGPAMRHTWPSVPQPWMTNPIDRVFVDVAAKDLATELLYEHLHTRPDLGDTETGPARVSTLERTDQAAWAQVVASYKLPSFASEGAATTEHPTPREPDPAEPARVVRAARTEPDLNPEPAEQARPSLANRSGWALLLASPTLLLVAAAFDWDLGGWLGAVGASAGVAGFTLLLTHHYTPPAQ